MTPFWIGIAYALFIFAVAYIFSVDFMTDIIIIVAAFGLGVCCGMVIAHGWLEGAKESLAEAVRTQKETMAMQLDIIERNNQALRRMEELRAK